MSRKVYIAVGLMLIGGVFSAWYWGVRFRLAVTETRIEAPSPRQQASGYDTLLRVVVKPRGRRPSWLPDATLNTLDDTQPELITAGGVSSIRRTFAFWDERGEAWELKYLLKLREVAPGKVTLRDRVALYRTRIARPDGSYDYPVSAQQESLPFKVEAVARIAGGTKFAPLRDTKLNVLNVSSGPAAVGANDRGRPIDATVRLEIQSGDSQATPFWDLSRFELVDAAGRRVDAPTARRAGESEPRAPFCLAHLDTLGRPGPREVITINVGWWGVAHGPLRIRGRIVLNHNWPLGVDIPIRDVRGRAVTLSPISPQSAPGVRIMPVEVVSKKTAPANNG